MSVGLCNYNLLMNSEKQGSCQEAGFCSPVNYTDLNGKSKFKYSWGGDCSKSQQPAQKIVKAPINFETCRLNGFWQNEILSQKQPV